MSRNIQKIFEEKKDEIAECIQHKIPIEEIVKQIGVARDNARCKRVYG